MTGFGQHQGILDRIGFSLTGPNACRAGLALTLLALSISLGTLSSGADPGAGVVISKDGGNVNVEFDQNAVSDIKWHRTSDGGTVFVIPKNADTRIKIDPSLKKGNLVQESETATEKTIKVNSQQVYVMTEDISAQDAARSAAKEASSATAKAAAARSGKSTPAATAIPIPKPVALVKSVPAATTATPARPVIAAVPPSSPTSSKPATASAAPKAAPPIIWPSILSVPKSETSPAHNHPAAQTANAKPVAMPASQSQPVPATLHTEAPPKPAATEPAAITPVTSDVEPLVPVTKTLPTAKADTADDNDETAPLTAAQKKQNPMQSAWIILIARLLLSLGVVLTLVRFGLPWLIQRYPGFFDQLEQQTREQRDAKIMQSNTPRLRPDPKPVRPPVQTPKPDEARPGFFAALGGSMLERNKAVKNTARNLPIPAGESKKSFLEKVQMDGDHFNVLTSTHLGKGKELHLVEIRGRQLVVATTPYTVSLIKDLTEPMNGNAASNGQSQEPVSEEQIRGLLGSAQMDETGLSGGEASPEDIREWEEETDSYYNPGRTHAYLEDDPPFDPRALKTERQISLHAPRIERTPQPETSRKPFASKEAVAPAEANPLDAIYKKYLDQSGEYERLRAETQMDTIQQELNRDRRHPRNHKPLPDTVDAEEVVVLEDYDDFYGA